MKRVIIFTAVSSDHQADTNAVSLPTQRQELERIARERQGTIVDYIEIPGFSRNYFNWFEFRDAAVAAGINGPLIMERHWQDQDFDEVIVWDGTRFGRKESIFAEFVLRTIESGATIYMLHGGELNRANHGPLMMMGAYASAQEGRIRKQRLAMGKDGRFEKELHGGGPIAMSHTEVYDAHHRPTGEYALNEAMLPVWADLETLILEGVGWHHIERELYTRYKHVNPETNRPFVRFTFYRLMTRVPMFWGHIARGYSYDRTHTIATENGPRHWVYDELWPVPAYVTVKRDVCPSVYTGEHRESVIAELRRRRDLKGKASPDRTMRFTSLCVCGGCGHSMGFRRVHKRKDGTYLIYVLCNYKMWNCSNGLSTRLEIIQDYFQNLLQGVLAGETWRLNPAAQDDHNEQRERLRQEISQIEGQLQTLINELSLTPEAARPFIRSRIESLSSRLVLIQQEIGALDRQTKRTAETQKGIEKTVEELRDMRLEEFWKQSDRQINQVLKRLLGGQRLVIKNKKIVGLA